MSMSQSQVEQQQGMYDRMGGAVFHDASFGFMPAFLDLKTRETHLSAYKDGEPAVIHILDGLPGHWISEWGTDGRAVALKSSVIAGFMRNCRFYTINEIMHQLRDS